MYPSQEEELAINAPWLRPEPTPEDLQPALGATAAAPLDALAAGAGPTPPPAHVLDVQHAARALQQRMQGQGARRAAADLHDSALVDVASGARAPLTLQEVHAQLHRGRDGGAATDHEVGVWRLGDTLQDLLPALLQAKLQVVAPEGVPLASRRVALQGAGLGSASAVESVVACHDQAVMQPAAVEDVGVLAWSEQRLAGLVQEVGQRVGSSAEALARAAALVD